MKRSMKIAAVGLLGLGVVGAGCGDDTSTTNNTNTTGDVTGPGHGDYHYYAVNKILLPQTNKEHAIDLNGDGKVDNQMGNIIGTLATQMLDAQSGVDASVADGSVVVLMSMQTNDATLKSDSQVGVTFYLGKTFDAKVDANGKCTSGCPDFGGMGMFTVDAAQAPADFWGKLNAGAFDSNNPITTTHPVSVTIKVALISGAPALPLVMNGAHLSFTSTATGLEGKLQGSIKNDDVQKTIIPAVAGLLTMKVAADPNSASSKQIAQIFDVGGCDGAKAGDNKIDTCEVAGNSIIQAVLAPDIQVYDANGNYAPNKANTKKDSLSIALGFTAVKGTFARP